MDMDEMDPIDGMKWMDASSAMLRIASLPHAELTLILLADHCRHFDHPELVHPFPVFLDETIPQADLEMSCILRHAQEGHETDGELVP